LNSWKEEERRNHPSFSTLLINRCGLQTEIFAKGQQQFAPQNLSVFLLLRLEAVTTKNSNITTKNTQSSAKDLHAKNFFERKK
jgi:hypothetical protein